MSSWFPLVFLVWIFIVLVAPFFLSRYHNEDVYFECWPMPFLPQIQQITEERPDLLL